MLMIRSGFTTPIEKFRCLNNFEILNVKNGVANPVPLRNYSFLQNVNLHKIFYTLVHGKYPHTAFRSFYQQKQSITQHNLL